MNRDNSEEFVAFQTMGRILPGLNRARLDELSRRLDLPRPECWAALDDFQKTYRLTFPVAAMLVDAGSDVRRVVDRMRAFRSMARAGLALVRDGEPAFREIHDPFGFGPFELEPRGNGYLIRSALKHEKFRPKEVVLEIGRSAKTT
jgi:hypothetical protein